MCLSFHAHFSSLRLPLLCLKRTRKAAINKFLHANWFSLYALQATPAAQLHMEPSLQDKRSGKGLFPISLGAAIPQDYWLPLLRQGQHAIRCNAFSMSRENKLITPSFYTRTLFFFFLTKINLTQCKPLLTRSHWPEAKQQDQNLQPNTHRTESGNFLFTSRLEWFISEIIGHKSTLATDPTEVQLVSLRYVSDSLC